MRTYKNGTKTDYAHVYNTNELRLCALITTKNGFFKKKIKTKIEWFLERI